MAKSEHVALIKEGKEAVDKWWKSRDDEYLDLSHANLEGADLSDFRLMNARLDGANLRNAILRNAALLSASLTGANLESACLEKCNLIDAKFSHAKLRHATLAGATANGSQFDDADLYQCNLKEASLHQGSFVAADLTLVNMEKATATSADFRRAVFTDAVLLDTDLTDANLEESLLDNTALMGSVFHRANLSGALFTKIRGEVVFDETKTGPTSPTLLATRSQWISLRRSYTGGRLAFHILFLCLFLLPHVGSTLLFFGISRTQSAVREATAPPTIRGEQREDLTIEPRFDPPADYAERPVWELALGVDRGLGHCFAIAILVFYNGCRFALTYYVSYLREHELASNYSPRMTEYRVAYGIHLIMAPLFLFSILVGVVDFYNVMTMPVSIPF